MEHLVEMTTFLTNTQPRKFTRAVRRRRGNSAVQSLSQLCQSNKNLDDASAAALLFNASAADQRYMTAKSRYKKFLLQQLFEWSPPEGSNNLVKANLFLGRQYAIVQTLFQFGIKNAAAELARKSLNIALEYSFSRFSAEFSNSLMIYAMGKGNLSVFQKYKQVYEEQLENYLAEGRLSIVMNEVLCKFNSSSAPKPSIADEIKIALEKEKKWKLRNPGFFYRLSLFQLRLYRELISGNPVLTLRVCDEAFGFLRANPKISTSKMKSEFELFKLDACIKLGMDQRAQVAAGNAFQLADPQSQHWIYIADKYMVFLIASRQLPKAAELLYSVKKDYLKRSKAENLKSRWMILEAWMELVKEITIPEYLDLPLKNKFKLSRFMNSFDTSVSHDLSGVKIEIRYLEMLFLLSRKDFSAFTDRIESLQAFIYRNLRKREDRRKLIFGKMLAVLEKKSFNPESTDKLVTRYRKELETTKYTRDLDGGELIEFGALWDWTISLLRETKSWKKNLTVNRSNTVNL